MMISNVFKIPFKKKDLVPSTISLRFFTSIHCKNDLPFTRVV